MEEAKDIVIKHNNLEQSVEILNRLMLGQTPRQISRDLDVSVQWVYQLKKKYLSDKS